MLVPFHAKSVCVKPKPFLVIRLSYEAAVKRRVGPILHESMTPKCMCAYVERTNCPDIGTLPFAYMHPLQAARKVVSIDTLVRDRVDSLKKRVVIHLASRLEQLVHLPRRLGTLQLLPVQQLLLELIERLTRLDKGFGALTISSAHTSGDQIRHTGRRLRKRLRLDPFEELFTEALHLHQTNPHNGGFSIVTPTQPIREPGSNGYNILERTTETDTRHILNNAHFESRSIEELEEQLCILPPLSSAL